MSFTSQRASIVCLLGFWLSGCGLPPGEEEGEAVEVGISSSLCSNQPLQLNGTNWVMSGDPAAVMFQGVAVFAFSRTDDKIQIIRETNTSSTCTTNTSTFVTLTDLSHFGPALIGFNNMLHLAYVGLNRRLYIKRSPNGIDWSEPTVLLDNNDRWMYRPALNVWNGGLRVYVMYDPFSTVTGDLVQIDVNSPSNGPMSQTGMSYLGQLSKSKHAPASTTWNNQIFVAWAGTSSNNPIYIMHFTDGLGWSAPTIVSGAHGKPSLFPTSSGLLGLIYRGNNSTIYSANSSNGTSFGSSTANSATSPSPPVPFLHTGSNIWTLYRGNNNGVYTFPMLQ